MRCKCENDVARLVRNDRPYSMKELDVRCPDVARRIRDDSFRDKMMEKGISIYYDFYFEDGETHEVDEVWIRRPVSGPRRITVVITSCADCPFSGDTMLKCSKTGNDLWHIRADGQFDEDCPFPVVGKGTKA